MVRMRWLALALVGCVATAAHAQSTQQDTAKAKVTTTAPKHHTAVSKISHKSTASSKAEMKAAHSSTMENKAADTAKAPSKSTASTKPEAKHMRKHVRKAKVKKDSSSTSKKG